MPIIIVSLSRLGYTRRKHVKHNKTNALNNLKNRPITSFIKNNKLTLQR